MANGWNSGREREAMLRRVAIVLSSLPAPLPPNCSVPLIPRRPRRCDAP